LVHDGFVLDGRQTVEAFLASATVVGPFDPGDDREAEVFAGGPAAPVEDVLLQEGEEGFHGRIVRAGADASHGADQARGVQGVDVGAGSEMAATIRMDDGESPRVWWRV